MPRGGGQPQSHPVVAGERIGIVDRQTGKQRDPLVIEQDVAHAARLVAVMGDQRIEQKRPVRCDPRGAVGADVGEVLGLALIVRGGEHAPVGGQQCYLRTAVRAVAVRVPRFGIGAAEPEQYLLRLFEGQVAPDDFDRQDRLIDVVEEEQLGSRHFEQQRLGPGAQRHPRLGDVAAAKHPHCRRIVRRLTHCGAFAEQETLHIGHERDEFAVMAFLEIGGIVGELVAHFGPRAALRDQSFPVRAGAGGAEDRGQLQRPDQDLAKFANHVHRLNGGNPYAFPLPHGGPPHLRLNA